MSKVITDEMVERASLAFHRASERGSAVDDACREILRAALADEPEGDAELEAMFRAHCEATGTNPATYHPTDKAGWFTTMAAARLALIEAWAASPPPELVADVYHQEGGTQADCRRALQRGLDALARRLRGGK
jgi:plasmid stability protein